MNSIFDFLVAASLADPKRDRLTFLHDDNRVETIDGQTLVDRSLRLSAGLSKITSPADRVLLAYPAGIDFVIGFLGCVHAGRIPVPVAYPKPKRSLTRYAAIASDCDAAVALSTAQTISVIDTNSLSGVRWLANDQMEANDQVEFEQPSTFGDLSSRCSETDRATFLQYTSGSTSQPKGVMVTANNLVSNLDVIRNGFQIDRLPPEQRRVCSWLPAYHDMGLVGIILSALAHDGHAIMMSPISFVQRPVRWLQAISDYRAPVTVAPCFGYQWAIEKISDADAGALDLSCLGLAGCGAEPIFAKVLEDFAERFSAQGFRYEAFYPCYGLAESTLMVSGTQRTESDDEDDSFATDIGPVTRTVQRRDLVDGTVVDVVDETQNDAVTLVSCGVAGSQTQIRIVDTKNGKVLPEGNVGEILISSPSVAAGYWKDLERTRQTFGASIENDKNAYLRSGDLGFLRDGQLFVTGRIKDLIILGGQNHYPQDIEQTAAASHPALSGMQSAAFSVDGEVAERLVIVHEIPRSTDVEVTADILRSIRLAVASNHEVAVGDVLLMRLASLPRTTSGKIQRFACRRNFLTGNFKAIAQWRYQRFDVNTLFPNLRYLIDNPSPSSMDRLQKKIERALCDWLAENTEVGSGQIAPEQSFAEMGVDSLLAVELSQQLEDWLAIRISPVAAWSHPTPQAMAEYLADQVAASDTVNEASPATETESVGDDIECLLAEIEAIDEQDAEELLSRIGQHPS